MADGFCGPDRTEKLSPRLDAHRRKAAAGREADPPRLVVEAVAVLAPAVGGEPEGEGAQLEGDGHRSPVGEDPLLVEPGKEALGEVPVTREVEGVHPRGQLPHPPVPGGRYTHICDCMSGRVQERRHLGLSVRIRADGDGQGLFELLGPGASKVELDPLEAVLVGVRTEAGPEAADLPVDGGPVPPAGLEAPETTGLVPGHPEADELGVLDDRLGDWSRTNRGYSSMEPTVRVASWETSARTPSGNDFQKAAERP